jgi:hypothetical protein
MKALLLIVLLLPGLAMAQAGRFLLAVGDVVVVRGASEIRAEIGSDVRLGDTIRVGSASNAQVRMTDESIVSLRSGSLFRIDDYVFAGKVDGTEKSIFSLLKGGMRTITGLIGRTVSRERYAVRTATSTIGIRGTHYTLVQCANDCAPGVQDGTYGGVTDGSIGVENKTGERQFGANEYFHVADANSVPQGLIAPPSFLFDRLEGQQRSSGQKGDETSEQMAQSGLNAESRPSEVPAAPAPEPFVVTEERTSTGTPTALAAAPAALPPTIGVLGSWATPQSTIQEGGGALVPASALTLDANGVPIAFQIPEGCIGPAEDCTGAPSGTLGAPSQSGFAVIPDSTDKIFWGAWAEGTITDGGVTFNLSSTNQAHLMYGALTPSDVIASKTGTLIYSSSLPGLGTIPTNNLGEQAFSGRLPTFTMDFTNRTFSTSSASIAFESQSWSFSPASGGTISVVDGQGAFFRGTTSGLCSGNCGGATSASAIGTAAGIFFGPRGDHAGVELTGSASNGTANFSTVRVYCTAGC